MKTSKYQENGVEVEELPLIGSPASIKTCKQGRTQSLADVKHMRAYTEETIKKARKNGMFMTNDDSIQRARISAKRILDNPKASDRQKELARDFFKDDNNRALSFLVCKIARALHRNSPCF